MAMTAFAATAVAQNLDPTVNVTRAYEGKLLEVDKPSFRMDVPDSVTKFNLDFDYSVMSNPYKGGNEFNPYLQDIRPERIDDKESSLWLRAGAGYGLHPELDFVWAPIRRNGFKMNIYGTHRSYVGRYRDIKVFEDGENYVLRPETYLINKEEKAFKGYDLSSRAGVNGRFDWESGTFLFDASYLGIATKDSLDTAFGVNDPDSKRAPGRDYNGADIYARARSNNNGEKYFFYDAALGYRFGQHNVATEQLDWLRESRLKADATLGPVLSYYHAILLGLSAEFAGYRTNENSKAIFDHAGRLSITPQYRYFKDRWNISAGLKVEFLARPEDVLTESGEVAFPAMNSNKGQVFYPAVDVNFAAIRDYLNIYFRADGGADINSYSSMLERDHWSNHRYSESQTYLVGARRLLLDNTVTRADVSLGVNGNIATVFDYDLRFGYANHQNYLFQAVSQVPLGESGILLPQVSYGSLQQTYAAFDFGVNTEMIDVKGGILWRYSFYGKNDDGSMREGFLPSPLKGDVEVTYNWRRRIFAGVSVEGALGSNALARVGAPEAGLLRLPGYIDLGLNFEYVMSKKLSAWAKGGNLACMTIQRTPLYAEAGPYFTAGICLNL